MRLSSVGVDRVHNEWVESEHVCRDAAMRDMFAQSETNRIKRFYQSRFKGSADNLVIAFRKLVDGIDLGIFDNVSGSKKSTAHCVTCRPTPESSGGWYIGIILC